MPERAAIASLISIALFAALAAGCATSDLELAPAVELPQVPPLIAAEFRRVTGESYRDGESYSGAVDLSSVEVGRSKGFAAYLFEVAGAPPSKPYQLRIRRSDGVTELKEKVVLLDGGRVGLEAETGERMPLLYVVCGVESAARSAALASASAPAPAAKESGDPEAAGRAEYDESRATSASVQGFDPLVLEAARSSAPLPHVVRVDCGISRAEARIVDLISYDGSIQLRRLLTPFPSMVQNEACSLDVTLVSRPGKRIKSLYLISGRGFVPNQSVSLSNDAGTNEPAKVSTHVANSFGEIYVGSGYHEGGGTMHLEAAGALCRVEGDFAWGDRVEHFRCGHGPELATDGIRTEDAIKGNAYLEIARALGLPRFVSAVRTRRTLQYVYLPEGESLASWTRLGTLEFIEPIDGWEADTSRFASYVRSLRENEDVGGKRVLHTSFEWPEERAHVLVAIWEDSGDTIAHFQLRQRGRPFTADEIELFESEF